jgi:hypothetical protein
MKRKKRSFFSEKRILLRYPITFVTGRIIGRIFMNEEIGERP